MQRQTRSSYKRREISPISEIAQRQSTEKKVARRKTKALPLKEKINREAPSNEFVVNEIVLATIPGFCAWPARIKAINNETITVQFFGTGHV